MTNTINIFFAISRSTATKKPISFTKMIFFVLFVEYHQE